MQAPMAEWTVLEDQMPAPDVQVAADGQQVLWRLPVHQTSWVILVHGLANGTLTVALQTNPSKPRAR